MFLFGANDVGPAKYLAELITCFKEEAFYLASDINKHVFDEDHGISIYDLNETLASRTNLVVTGTSFGDEKISLDKRLVVWAKKNNIPSVSVIEHWGWYRKRFQARNTLILPNYILVNDQLAYTAAIKEGLPENILRSLGNPYLESLSTKPLNFLRVNQLKEKYNLPKNKRLLVFISEELKNFFKQGSADDLGYDEFEVIKNVIQQLNKNDYLVIKLHPEEDFGKYNCFRSKSITVLKDCPLGDLVVMADSVIGMASMLLLELSIYRNDIISFRPNALQSFIGEDLLLTVPVKNPSELSQALCNKAIAKQSLQDYFLGSKQRIKQFLLGVHR
jgi:hypothetical protein